MCWKISIYGSGAAKGSLEASETHYYLVFVDVEDTPKIDISIDRYSGRVFVDYPKSASPIRAGQCEEANDIPVF